MKKIINLLKYDLFFYLVITSFAFSNIKCKMTLEQFGTFFEGKTLDRIRQLYWNIIVFLENGGEYDIRVNHLKRSYAEENLHSIDRDTITWYLKDVYNYIDTYYIIEFQEFELIMDEIDLFKINKIDDLFSNQMPRHFLINMAINVDKYERIIKNKLDGISDYINFLTNERIIEYLHKKYEEYKDDIEQNFDKILLNNIKFDYENVNEYYKSKTREELIDIVHGVENYLFNELNKSKDDYYFYKHGELINIEDKDIYQRIALYNKEMDLTKIDDFMYKIEFRNFEYINSEQFINSIGDKSEDEIIVLEKYYKRQMNLTKSLRELNDYVNHIPEDNRKKILKWGLSLYPELYCDGIFTDISSSEINLKYGEVKDFIQVTERNVLLRYIYNIHTYQNSIISIYDDKLFNLYRYPNEMLFEVFLSDTNLNRYLQEKDKFLEFADFHKDNLYAYISNLQRNQLKEILSSLIKIYYIKKKYYEGYKVHSEITTKSELLEYYNKEELINQSKYYIEETPINITTSEFLNTHREELGGKDIRYYNNIYDFLISTDIYYLKQWLRKIENYYRNTYSTEGMKGGMKFDYMNDYRKDELLALFDVYITNIPDYFEPINLINNFGLDKDITPHKMIFDLFLFLREYNTNGTLKKICYSLTGYYQRKNIQTNFDVDKFITEFNKELENYKEIFFSYIFQFFRLINMFPELNNIKIFEMVCLNNKTRVINLDESDYLESYFNKSLYKLATNIQYYFNNTNQYDNTNLNDMGDEGLQKYILSFLQNPKFSDKKELKSQILDGYFPFIIYDYFESYLNSIDDEHLNFIFNNVKHICSQNYPCNETSQATTKEEKKIEIIKDIKNVQEFQNPDFFDKNFDYIENVEKGSFKEFLVNSTNKDLKSYTIVVYIIQLERCENKTDNFCQDITSDHFYKKFYMSRNEMIRYILKEHEVNKIMINENMLPLLVKYYMIDIGSDDINDLTLY